MLFSAARNQKRTDIYQFFYNHRTKLLNTTLKDFNNLFDELAQIGIGRFDNSGARRVFVWNYKIKEIGKAALNKKELNYEQTI